MLDSTTIKGIISTFGINNSTASGLASYGIKGIFYALLFFLLRFLIQKFIWVKLTKWLSTLTDSKNQHLDVLTQIKDNLHDLKDLFEKSNDKLDRQSNNIHLLLEDASGELDKNLAVNVSSNYLEKINYRIEAFFKLRLEQNHLKDNEVLIQGKYKSYSQRLAPKIEAQFNLFTYNGKSLADFWGDGGAFLYVSTIMNDLFELHKAVVYEKNNCIIGTDELSSHLDNIISYMIGAMNSYCENGIDFGFFFDNNPMPSTCIMTAEEIEYINELIEEAKDE